MVTNKKTPFGEVATEKKKLNNLILSQKIVQIQFPEFKEENKLKIECCVWDQRIEIAKANPISFRPSFKIGIASMQQVRKLLASGVLRK